MTCATPQNNAFDLASQQLFCTRCVTPSHLATDRLCNFCFRHAYANTWFHHSQVPSSSISSPFTTTPSPRIKTTVINSLDTEPMRQAARDGKAPIRYKHQRRFPSSQPLTAPPLLASSLIVAWHQTVAGTSFCCYYHSDCLPLPVTARLCCRPGLLWILPGHLSLRGNWLYTNPSHWSSRMLTHTLSQPGYAIVSGGTTSRHTGYLSRRSPSLRSQDFLDFFRQLATLLSYRYTSLRSASIAPCASL